jgi:hypothetical protein
MHWKKIKQNLINHVVAIRDIMDSQKSKDVTIRTQKPGDAGYIAYRHCVLYEKEYGLGGTFEQYVLDSLVKYIEHRSEGEIWVAVCQESSFTHQLLMHECAMLQRRWR